MEILSPFVGFNLLQALLLLLVGSVDHLSETGHFADIYRWLGTTNFHPVTQRVTDQAPNQQLKANFMGDRLLPEVSL